MPPQIPDVLARVNGEKIERWEFDNAVKRMEARAGGPVPPDKRDEVLRGVLDQLVAYHLLAQESRVRKLPVPDTDVDARLADIRKSFPTEDAFKQGIAAQGLTLDQLKAQAENQPRSREGDRLRGQLEGCRPDPEVKGFYDQNLERFKQGDTRARGAHPDRHPAERDGRAEDRGEDEGRCGAEDGEGRRRFCDRWRGRTRRTPAARRTAATSAFSPRDR